MPKVGLKDTLALLAKGYSKKEIDALAAVDDENEANPAPDPVPETPPPAPEPKAAPAEPEPDNELEQVKARLDDTLKKLKESEEKISKLQQDNVHKDSAPASEEAKQKEQESLLELFRSSM